MDVVSVPDEDFTAEIGALRYCTGRRDHSGGGGTSGRWQLGKMEPGGSLGPYFKVVEDDVPVERALALARLLGCEDKARAAMQEHALSLRARARDRLESSRRERQAEEVRALEERKRADAIMADARRAAA